MFCGSSYRDCTTAAILVNRDAIVVLKTAHLKVGVSTYLQTMTER
jgi:hypothetical protein